MAQEDWRILEASMRYLGLVVVQKDGILRVWCVEML